MLALMARAKLDGFDALMRRRDTVSAAYRATLPPDAWRRPRPGRGRRSASIRSSCPRAPTATP
ncbi:hypothetical protein AB5I41_24830 [Sphingomonas sp. MMS24-JH45]